jgi:putative SOS response-associated peptidase YedK
MCGRFISGADETSWAEYCTILRLPTATPAPTAAERAPGQAIEVVRAGPDACGARELTRLRWGLLPHWVTDRKDASKLINVRSETAGRKFARYLERQRCVIPAAGFFEWQQTGPGRPKAKILIRDRARPVISLAGLWSLWTGEDGETVETCAILTTGPSGLVRPIHDRMPVILTAEAADEWLGPGRGARELAALLQPYEAPTMAAEPEVAHDATPAGPSQGELF